MKDNTRLIVKGIYNVILFLYLITIGIVAYITKKYFILYYYKILFAILGIYLSLGGVISIIYKLNLNTPKLRKFDDVDRSLFDFNSYVTAIVYILFGLFLTILFGFVQF